MSKEPKEFEETLDDFTSPEKNMKSAMEDATVKRGYRTRSPKNESHMFSFRLPDALKERIKAEAARTGRSMGEQIIESIEDSLAIQRMIEAVRECLQEYPPPFREDGWTPTQGDCMSFILEQVHTAIMRREDQMGN